MKSELMEKIKQLKKKFEPEGFVILGVFGSFARGDESAGSDVDILYRLERKFLEKNIGWSSCNRIEEIQEGCAGFLQRPVDLADINALDSVGKYFILPEVVYVA